MNLLAFLDEVVLAIGEVPSGAPQDALLGLPSSLTGIDLDALEDVLSRHQGGLESQLGRDVHPAVALLDLIETGNDLSITLADLFILKKTALRGLVNAAIYDNLTGLYSRNIFETRLREEFQRARRYDIPLSILFIETDSFKSFNDTFGHLEGDRALSFIGRYIRDHIREVDFPARYGGDEFIVVLPHTDGDTGMGIAYRIHDEIADTQKSIGLKARVTISIGVGMLVENMETEEQLIEAADQGSYRAKLQKDMVWPHVNADPVKESQAPVSFVRSTRLTLTRSRPFHRFFGVNLAENCGNSSVGRAQPCQG